MRRALFAALFIGTIAVHALATPIYTSCKAVAEERDTAPKPIPYDSRFYKVKIGGVIHDMWCDMETEHAGLKGGWTLVWSNLRGGAGKLTTQMPHWRAVNSPPVYRKVMPPMRALQDFEVYTGVKHLWALASENGGRREVMYRWAPDFGWPREKEWSAACKFTIDPEDKYKIDFSGSSGSACVALSGNSLPGFYTYHDEKKFSAMDEDNDLSEHNCSTYRGSGTPFWYGGCWDGSIWGVGEYEPGGHKNGSHWVGYDTRWADDAPGGQPDGTGAGNGWLFVR